jgi:hypothetical protein
MRGRGGKERKGFFSLSLEESSKRRGRQRETKR